MLSGTGKTIILIFLILIVSAAGLSAQSLSLSAELKKDKIWLGESVQLTVYLQGSEQEISPELIIPEVDIVSIGGAVNSSRSVTNINGRVTEKISKAYIYGYLLTPEKDGQFIIPPIKVVIDGNELTTRALFLNVEKPGTSEDFKLELKFDRDKVYIDEECRLKISFLYNISLRTLEIKIPGLETVPNENIRPQDVSDGYEISVNGNPVIFKREDRGGFAGLSAEFLIRPDKSGELILANSTASFERVLGYRNVQDFFGRTQKQEVYEETVIAGNLAFLEIKNFPEKDRPDDFFGLSGDIVVDVGIEPDDVHIGDPVTLKLRVAGMNNTDIKIPPLGDYLGTGIDIPDTRSSAKVEGRSKTITQTVRIKNASVTQIPPVSFCFFNTETESYEYSSSQAVPIKVLDTKIITAAEIERYESGEAENSKVLLEKTREGIYHNYSGKRLLSSDQIMIYRLTESILIKILLLIPPSVFLIILIYTGLLPQVRARAEARADRSRALRRLKRWTVKSGIDDPKSYIKEFKRLLTAFLNAHGGAEDYNRLTEISRQINAVLYGKEESSPGEIRYTAVKAVEILEMKEVRNA